MTQTTNFPMTHNQKEAWWSYGLMLLGVSFWFCLIISLGLGLDFIMNQNLKNSATVKLDQNRFGATSKKLAQTPQENCWQAIPELNFSYQYDCARYETSATNQQIQFWLKSEPKPTPAQKPDACDSEIIKIYQPKTAPTSLETWVTAQTGIKKFSLPPKAGLPGQICLANQLNQKNQLEVSQPNSKNTLPMAWRYYSFLPLNSKTPIILRTSYCTSGILACDAIQAIKSWP